MGSVAAASGGGSTGAGAGGFANTPLATGRCRMAKRDMATGRRDGCNSLLTLRGTRRTGRDTDCAVCSRVTSEEDDAMFSDNTRVT